MAKVLVTGANGHIGANTVRVLLDEGHEVVGLVRQGADTRGLQGLPLTRVVGDILDADSVKRAMEGCEFVIHHAAVYAMRGATPEEIMRPSMEGVTHVLQAAKAAGIQRVVHTSSEAAVGYEDSPDGRRRTEKDWNDEARAPYYVAKREAEKRAMQLAGELGVPLVSLCPGGVLGAYDYRITPTTKLILDMAAGTGSSGNGGLALVDVRDVALAHVRALTRGADGGRYLVSGENITLRDIGRVVGGWTGKKVPYLPMPRWLVPIVVPAMESGFRAFGKEPIVTLDEAREVLGHYPTFDCSATERDLQMEFKGAEQCIEHALRWLVHLGALPGKVQSRLGSSLPPDPAWAA